MLIADGIGIIGGAWMCKHIPEIYIKWAAGIIFIFFGTLTIYSSVPSFLISPMYLIPYFLTLGVLIYIIGVKLAYHGEACSIALSHKDITKDNTH